MEQEQFAIVELMGHRKFGARISEADQFGQKFMRAEILTPGEPVVQLVHPQSVYAITSCTEKDARAVNSRWALQAALPMLPDVVQADDARYARCEECGIALTEDETHRDDDGVPFCKPHYDQIPVDDEPDPSDINPVELEGGREEPDDGTRHGGDGTDAYHG